METIIKEVKVHQLRVEQGYYKRILNESISFIVALNDVDFQTGDEARLSEYEIKSEMELTRNSHIRITYVMSSCDKIKEGYCVFGFEVINHFG